MDKTAYKIKNNYVTVLVEGYIYDVDMNMTFVVLKDGTRIPADLFGRMYNIVNGTKIGDSSFVQKT